MKKLLIHNNNTFFNQTDYFKIEEQFVFGFDSENVDIDSVIHDELTIGELKDKITQAEVIFIKISLSKNYLEYIGLRLAYHIRLTKSLGLKSQIPIVFVGEESIQFLGLTYSEPSITLTKGIYFIKESIEDYLEILTSYNEGKIRQLEDFKGFVNSINITPPVNYQSHHSIANEWALARYFSMFEKEDKNEKYNLLEEKISNLSYLKTLHFKFTDAKILRQNFNPKKHSYTPHIKEIKYAEIGIIDDDINKGWLAFYDYWFDKSGAIIRDFSDFYKDESREDLITRIKAWLLEIALSNKPIDIYVIDLRLHTEDFSESNFDNLSGVKLIQYIKYLNPGIQIVVSTASNKVWNYQQCLKHGVSYYAIKESPETFNSREETKVTLNHLSNQITSAYKKIFLAKVFRSVKKLKESNLVKSEKNNSDFSQLVFDKNGILDQITNLLILDSNNEAIVNQCLLLCFQVLENYCDLSSVASFGRDNRSKSNLSSGFIWLKSGDKKDIFMNHPGQKISTWFELINGKFDLQVAEANETPISFKVFEKMEIVSSYRTGLDSTSLVKMISVLYFRDNICISDVERIIKLRYYRSNVAAHLTGKVKSDYKRINSDDISFFINLFNQLF